jgi:chaperone modulatory protein CbpM
MRHITQIILSDALNEETLTFTLAEFSEQYDVQEKMLFEMLEHSLIEPQELTAEGLYIDVRALRRMQSAVRLQRDLDINLPGIALVLELVEQLEHVRGELEILQRHIDSASS